MSTTNKVAAVTLIFWLMKIVATTLGETLGDFIAMSLGFGYAAGIGITLLFFTIVLGAQLSVKRYIPFMYWLVITGTTTLGTEISDFIDRSLGLGYGWGSILLLAGLALTLALWFYKYRNLEVYPVADKPQEMLYWAAILFSNSLGTAFGDYLSDDVGLSYLNGALVTGAIILGVVLIHSFTRINHIILFWVAFVFTRPFGATFGDFLTKPLTSGGLALSTLWSSLVSVAIMVVLVYIAHRQHAKAAV